MEPLITSAAHALLAARRSPLLISRRWFVNIENDSTQKEKRVWFAPDVCLTLNAAAVTHPVSASAARGSTASSCFPNEQHEHMFHIGMQRVHHSYPRS